MIGGGGERCGCAHAAPLHAGGTGPCLVDLPPFLEEELPAWRCPCPGYRAAPRGPWRWHERTGSWAAVLEAEADCSPLNSPPGRRRGARVAGEAPTGVNLPDTRAS